MSKKPELRFGTCSWNYDSWIGSVYSGKQKYSGDYLPEYSEKYNTVEIDSWFYRIPDKNIVIKYIENVGDNFRFTAKVPQIFTKPLLFGRNTKEVNFDFLSADRFLEFIDVIEPILPIMTCLIFQFEYLNKQKMESLTMFLDKVSVFKEKIPKKIPIAFEIRNSNYIQENYFSTLNELGIMPVLVEKVYMPPINTVYDRFKSLINDTLIIRLLGGDRKEIESLTNNKWNRIVAPKNNIGEIAELIKDASSKINVTVNINNHYEGSGPSSIDRIRKLIVT
jgi:uncharacterized protein YecE (DUF72 family)